MLHRTLVAGSVAFALVLACVVSDARPAGRCGADEKCVAAVPQGWSGPVLVHQGTGAAPACPSATTLSASGGSGMSAPGATCSPCTCGVPSNGICAASKVSATVPPIAWTTHTVVCAPSDTATCSGGACAPSATGFRVCVRQSGDVACPASGYSTKIPFDAAGADTRGCSACSCGAGTVACPVSGGQPTGNVATTHGTLCCL